MNLALLSKTEGIEKVAIAQFKVFIGFKRGLHDK